MKYRKLNTRQKIRAFCWAVFVTIILGSVIAVLSSCEPSTAMSKQDVTELAESIANEAVAPLILEIDTLKEVIVFQDSIINRLIIQCHVLWGRDTLPLQYIGQSMGQIDYKVEQMQAKIDSFLNPGIPPEGVDLIKFLFLGEDGGLYVVDSVELIRVK